jgi:polysaccharide export outer membrane protein
MRKIVFSIVILTTLIGCIPTEKLKYVVAESDIKNDYYNNRSEKTIQPYDYLYIKIYSLDEKTNSIFNIDERSLQNEQLISYEVNERGFINFPFVGDIFVKGLTIDEAKNKLEKELNQYLTNISVRVRFVGNKITILGEVNQPGCHTFFDEKISIFEALGLANDVASFGNKTKITLIREKNDTVKYQYLDLTNKHIAESDYYYLLPNDILIVDPVRAKYRTLQENPVLYLLFSAISTISTSVTAAYFIRNW